MSATEFPAGSRWRRRDRKRVTVILYGEAGGIVTFRGAEDDQPMTETAASFARRFERIEHPEAPKQERETCPESKGEGWAIPKSQFDDGVRCSACKGRGLV